MNARLIAILLWTAGPAFGADPPDPALYAKQQRSAAVLDHLVRQTPQYWDGMGAATQDRMQREAQAASAPVSGASVAGQRAMTREEEAAWKNAQSDMNSRFSTGQDKRNARETMRMIESRSNPNVPAAPIEVRPSSTVIDTHTGRAMYCHGRFCH